MKIHKSIMPLEDPPPHTACTLTSYDQYEQHGECTKLSVGSGTSGTYLSS
jgi:hypothetical protein